MAKGGLHELGLPLIFGVHIDVHIDVQIDVHIDVQTDVHIDVHTDVHRDVHGDPKREPKNDHKTTTGPQVLYAYLRPPTRTPFWEDLGPSSAISY